MPGPNRNSELALVIGFLAVIAAVPVTQTCLELVRHERVQAVDVFRYEPTAKNLRQFEHTLQEKSWFQQTLRPPLQQLLFATLRDTGAKGMLGRDQWLFYRPDVRYLVEPDRLETGPTDTRWVAPPSRLTRRQSVEQAIVRFRDQLKERGIGLVVMPVPGKPSIYPDQVTGREAGKAAELRSPTLRLIEALESQGVSVVNLFPAFQAARAGGGPLYLAHDTHWTPRGAELAAQIAAARLRALPLASPGQSAFQLRRVPVLRSGDILDMMQIPGLREKFPAEAVECVQVTDAALGPMLPGASARPGTYCYPGQQATVLVLGDSFSRIYQYAEPQSLGELAAGATNSVPVQTGTKRLLPGSAGFVSHLALQLRAPVDAIVSDGGAATDVRRKLSTDPEILEGKKVVVWEFVERDIALGAQGWEPVELPRKLQ